MIKLLFSCVVAFVLVVTRVGNGRVMRMNLVSIMYIISLFITSAMGVRLLSHFLSRSLGRSVCLTFCQQEYSEVTDEFL